MTLRSMYPRWLLGPGSSSTGSQRNDILPMTSLTFRSSVISPPLTWAFALFPAPQVGRLNSRLGLGQRDLADNRNFLARNPCGYQDGSAHIGLLAFVS